MRPSARLFALLLLLAALAAPLRTSAQDTANPFADLGLPEIAITVTDTAFDGAPSELEAGRYVLSVANSSSSEDDAGVGRSAGASPVTITGPGACGASGRSPQSIHSPAERSITA